MKKIYVIVSLVLLAGIFISACIPMDPARNKTIEGMVFLGEFSQSTNNRYSMWKYDNEGDTCYVITYEYFAMSAGGTAAIDCMEK